MHEVKSEHWHGLEGYKNAGGGDRLLRKEYKETLRKEAAVSKMEHSLYPEPAKV